MRTQTEEITNHADIIDSRDIIARIEALESIVEPTECSECSGTGRLTEDGEADHATDAALECELCNGTGHHETEADSGEAEELKTLKELAEQCEGYGDWKYGETLIRDSYFEDYVQELAEDYGMIQDGAKWPYTCIDWERAARELQYDYTSVEFDGITYWMRS